MPASVVVLGNGPSLRGFDYSTLEGRFVIACNRIHLVYPTTTWRPDLYVCVDRAGNCEHIVDDMRFHADQGYPMVISDGLAMECFNDSDGNGHHPRPWAMEPRLRIIPRCHHKDEFPAWPIQWHEPHLCSFAGPVHIGIQLAVLELGATEIELLGVDAHYEPFAENHMVKDYVPLETYGDRMVDIKNRSHPYMLTVAADECARRGVTLTRIT